MDARWTTFRSDPSAIDDGIADVRDAVGPAVRQMAGCVGGSVLVDRHTGRCIVTSLWEDAGSLQRSEEALRGIDETAAAALRAVDGRQVEQWEIGVLHRVRDRGEGTATRVIRTKGPIGPVDRVVDAFRATVVPRVEDLPGFCGVSLLVDPRTGRGAIEATYESRQTMSRAKGQAQAIRQEFIEHVGMRVTEVAEFDLVLARLPLPESV